MHYKANGKEQILIPIYVIEMRLSAYAINLYLYIAENVQNSEDGFHKETQPETALKIGCSSRQITRAMKELVNKGLITIEKVGVNNWVTTTDKFD